MASGNESRELRACNWGSSAVKAIMAGSFGHFLGLHGNSQRTSTSLTRQKRLSMLHKLLSLPEYLYTNKTITVFVLPTTEIARSVTAGRSDGEPDYLKHQTVS